MSEKVILAIIENANGWIVSFGGLLVAVGGLLSAAASAWAVLKSRKATKEVAAQKVVTEQQSSTICDLQDEACRAQALAIHATQEMVSAREETRKLHEFIQTDVFNAGVLQSLATSGRPPLEPLTDPAPLDPK